MNLKKYFIYAVVSLTVFSCAPRQEINYMKDIEGLALENSVKNSRTTLQPGDQLIITVSAKDLDVVKPFNQNYTSSGVIAQYSLPSGNMRPVEAQSTGPTYQIDTDGNILFPQLGQINTKDHNLETFRVKLADMLKTYISNPIVDVKLINFKVTFLGEFNRPGTFIVPEGNTSLLSALGLAGDLTPFGLRKNVLIIRNVDGKFTQERVDLTSAQFINSPYYYLKQNDLIYVQSNTVREKSTRIDPNTGLYISVASIIASIALSVLALTKN